MPSSSLLRTVVDLGSGEDRIEYRFDDPIRPTVLPAAPP
jgi:hypothetical protein